MLTGFIPKGQNYFGCRYAESSRYAVKSFESDQQNYQSKMDELQTLSQQQGNDGARQNFTIAQNTTPLMPIAEAIYASLFQEIFNITIYITLWSS